jgi:hypothetical protein
MTITVATGGTGRQHVNAIDAAGDAGETGFAVLVPVRS